MNATRHSPAVDAGHANGPAMGAMLAAGVGCTALGLLTVLAEVSAGVKSALNLYDPVGPLSGVSLGATAAYVLSWIGLGIVLRGREVRPMGWIAATLVLIVIGLVLTFPPVYQAFSKS